MLKKGYAIFELCDAVTGISNQGLEYDNYIYTLRAGQVFNYEDEAFSEIERIMKDIRRRLPSHKVRYTVMPIMVFENDQVFNQ